MPRKNKHGEYIFKDYPDFKPNVHPKNIINQFGGTYFRDIYSTVAKKKIKNRWKKYPKSWFKGLTLDDYASQKYDKNKNKYKVKVGSTLKEWEDHNWIKAPDYFGQFEWYINFFLGRRIKKIDEYQINRWKKTAGPKSRFRLRLINMIIKKKSKYNDYSISPKIRQVLLHWGYELTSKDFNDQVNENKLRTEIYLELIMTFSNGNQDWITIKWSKSLENKLKFYEKSKKYFKTLNRYKTKKLVKVSMCIYNYKKKLPSWIIETNGKIFYD